MGFEDDVDILSKSLKRMPVQRAAVVFMSSSQRLYPLYSKFIAKEKWVPSAELGLVLESLWNAVGVSRAPEPKVVESILMAAPDGGQFDNLEATLALDFCICLDAAARCLMSDRHLDFRVIDANLEAVRLPLCFQRSGFLDFPDDERFSSIETDVRSDERYLREMARINEDIQEVLLTGTFQQSVEAVRSRAAANAITWEYLGL
jgi:hypothetical protein